MSSIASAAETVTPVTSLAQLEATTVDAPMVSARALEPVESVCKRISDKLASVAYQECAVLQLQHSGHRSVQDIPLLIKEYPPLGKRRPQARILLVGGTHGDELAAISIVFKWMHTLEKHHSGLFHWRINPLMNPDGALRKKHRRTNANGVDLNRNFATPDSDDDAALEYWRVKTKESAPLPGAIPAKRTGDQLAASGNQGLQTGRGHRGTRTLFAGGLRCPGSKKCASQDWPSLQEPDGNLPGITR